MITYEWKKPSDAWDWCPNNTVRKFFDGWINSGHASVRFSIDVHIHVGVIRENRAKVVEALNVLKSNPTSLKDDNECKNATFWYEIMSPKTISTDTFNKLRLNCTLIFGGFHPSRRRQWFLVIAQIIIQTLICFDIFVNLPVIGAI